MPKIVTANLYVRGRGDKGYVASVSLPDFDPKPEIIIWGERYFTNAKSEDQLVYFEAFAWHAAESIERFLREREA